MKDVNIDHAVQEAKRFLACASNFAKVAAPEKSVDVNGDAFTYRPSCPKESGALRRASLDLTRALANMRKP